MGSPSPRAYGGMVVHGECVIVFGGIGTSSLHASEKGAKTIKDDKFGGEIINEWNNSIHEYNTVTGIVQIIRKIFFWYFNVFGKGSLLVSSGISPCQIVNLSVQVSGES